MEGPVAIVEIVHEETGEIEEVEVGADDLMFYAHQRMIATSQVKAWQSRLAMVNNILMEAQETKIATYASDVGDLVVTKRDESYTASLDMEALLKEELTREDLRTLLMACKGIDLKKLDAGLRGSDPAKMTPKTNLGKLVLEFLTRTPYKNGYIYMEAARRLAGEP